MNTQVITAQMTLPELVEVADKHRDGKVLLTEAQRHDLEALLHVYAEDVLEDGQCVQMGSVELIKTLSGKASVKLLK